MKNSKQLLFYPKYLDSESDTFVILQGGQMTVVAFGLMDEDKVTFEVVSVPAIEAEACVCPPFQVDLPSVQASFPLMIDEKEVTLDENNPYVILDSPQNFRVRAVLDAVDASRIYVWVTETMTHDNNDRLRGK